MKCLLHLASSSMYVAFFRMGESFVCINCLHPTDSLYKKYSAEVIRLTECVSAFYHFLIFAALFRRNAMML